MAYNPEFLQGILPRLDWDAVRITAGEVCITLFRELLFGEKKLGGKREPLLIKSQ